MIVFQATKFKLINDDEAETKITLKIDASQVVEVAKFLALNKGMLLKITIEPVEPGSKSYFYKEQEE